MAAHKKSLMRRSLAACCVRWLLCVRPASPYDVRLRPADRPSAQTPQRIVSIVPSVTEMLFAMGAGPRVVGVSNFDPLSARSADAHEGRRPDRSRHRADHLAEAGSGGRLRHADRSPNADGARAAFRSSSTSTAGLADITTTIRADRRADRQSRGKRGARRSNRGRRSPRYRKRVAGRPRPRTLLVFGRDAETLRGIYASGGIGFLHDMLEAAGGTNVFADVKRQSIQATSELGDRARPDVIVEIGADTASSQGAEPATPGTRCASVPAVRNKRIYQLTRRRDDEPGPAHLAPCAVGRVLHQARSHLG